MDFEKKLDKQLKRMKNLKSFKNKPDIDILKSLLMKEWEENAKRKKFETSPLSWLINVFNGETLLWLEEEYKKTQNDFVFNDSSDIQQLQAYLWRLGRNKVLAEEIRDDPEKEAANMTFMAENMAEMLKIGKSLKLNKEQRLIDAKQKTLEESLVTIYNRVETYVKNHRGQFLWRCFHCKQMNLLNDTPNWIFENDTPFSKECWDLVVEGVLTLQQMGTILQTSSFGIREMAKKRGLWEEKFDEQVK